MSGHLAAARRRAHDPPGDRRARSRRRRRWWATRPSRSRRRCRPACPSPRSGVDAAVNAAVLAAADRGDRRHGGAGHALEVQGRPGGGPQALIPRYSLPEMAAVWSDEARLANWLEIELLAVEAWAELGRIPPEDARAIRERASFTVERGARGRGGHPPRRRRVRPGGGGLDRARGPLDPLRADVVGRAGHRAWRCSCARRPTCCSNGSSALLGVVKRLALRAPGHRDDRPLARDPRRADQRSATSSRSWRSSWTATASACAGRGRR